MEKDGLNQDWPGECNPESEKDLCRVLQSLLKEGGNGELDCSCLIRHPYVLGLVKLVTRKGLLARDSEWRFEWRAETLILLGEEWRSGGPFPQKGTSDLSRIVAYVRMVVYYTAMSASWEMLKERFFRVRHHRDPEKRVNVACVGDSSLDPVDKRQDGPDLLRLQDAVRRAVLSLEDEREREVMTKVLSGEHYTLKKIAEELGTSVDQVRQLIKRAKRRLREILEESDY